MKTKLIDYETGDEIKPDVNGDLRMLNGDKFKFGELVPPCRAEPQGLVKSKPNGLGWQQHYPSVFGGIIIQEFE